MARGGGGGPAVFQHTGVLRTVARICLFYFQHISFFTNFNTINTVSQVGDSLPKEMWHQLDLMEKRIELFAEEEEEEEADIY